MSEGKSNLRRAKELLPVAGGPGVDLRDAAFFEKWPTFCDFLCLDRWDDGSARRPGTVTVFFEEGSWKCWLNDRDQGLAAVVCSTSIEGLWEAAEAALNGEGAQWRRQAGKFQKKR